MIMERDLVGNVVEVGSEVFDSWIYFKSFLLLDSRCDPKVEEDGANQDSKLPPDKLSSCL